MNTEYEVINVRLQIVLIIKLINEFCSATCVLYHFSLCQKKNDECPTKTMAVQPRHLIVTWIGLFCNAVVVRNSRRWMAFSLHIIIVCHIKANPSKTNAIVHVCHNICLTVLKRLWRWLSPGGVNSLQKLNMLFVSLENYGFELFPRHL